MTEFDTKHGKMLNDGKTAKKGLTTREGFAIIINVVARTANTLRERQRRSLKTIQRLKSF